ncbi:hypothetical protein ACM614_07465 [Streptomyces sp. 12297]
MILTLAMPVAAGATVWTSGGRGDEPAILGLVLASALVSPLTVPVTVSALTPLLSAEYAQPLAAAADGTGAGFALTGVLLPCAAGIACRLLLPVARSAPYCRRPRSRPCSPLCCSPTSMPAAR